MKQTELGVIHRPPEHRDSLFFVACCGCEVVVMTRYEWAGYIRWTGRCPVCGVVHYTEDVPVGPPPLEVDV